MFYQQYETQAQLDKQYNAEQSVDDFRVYADAYVASSQKARAVLRCDLDIAYGPTRDEHFDLFYGKKQPGQGKAPILLFIHGGYWRRLSSKEFSCVAFGPTAAGIHLFNINYSLAPKVGIAEITRQIYAAIAFIWHHAQEWGCDNQRIYLSGHSAGAHLAAMALFNDWQGNYGLPPDIIKGAFLVSGLYDLSPLRYSFLQPALQFTADDVRDYSPQFLMRPSPLKIVVTVGGKESEAFHQQSQDFLQSWVQMGNVGKMLMQPSCNHFDAIDGFGARDTEFCQTLLELMGLG